MAFARGLAPISSTDAQVTGKTFRVTVKFSFGRRDLGPSFFAVALGHFTRTNARGSCRTPRIQVAVRPDPSMPKRALLAGPLNCAP
jgi:hypothetical protein